MFSFETNKIAGAILGSLLLAMGLGVIGQMIFSHPALKTPGFNLPALAEGGESGGAPAAEAVASLPERLAKADVKRGESLTKACQACHSFEKGGAAKVGPPLFGVVGRPKDSIAGFGYSDAMKAKGGAWTFDDLDHFIASPKGFISGTKMGFAGEPDPQKRADIIAYLRTLSDSPVPLPAPGK
ncbi:cytochrome c class I [Methylocella silvestris BL2]|uniref:Cytochrome c class I n=1 Tax=Methylocella silvestris (strain DSM 15510 / CIP 108128 / LMG 27833 / NCIMB 13906 / BL2) TaxID=395965 RepID=B8EMW5_METSB|nr:cytochrome c family protein [Methylocella silvestris]ACK52794.1 cytochrome c class I [Methylocella silvestris BL2]